MFEFSVVPKILPVTYLHTPHTFNFSAPFGVGVVVFLREIQTMNTTLKAALFSTFIACSFAGAVHAADTGTFEVKMTVNGSCNVTVPGTIDFGSVGANAQVAAQNATLKVNCTAGENPKVLLTSQNNWNMKGTGTGTRGNNDGKLVPYQLFHGVNAATSVWNEENPVSVTGTGTESSYAIYATAGQATHSGVYTDTVTVSLQF